ncbi:MAG: hypothetical protein A2845_03690 [Candidatus Lloydbacteria bacterium RIFCSPHIGHO2_01_FULL_49_22]|uniref:Uncharacterized protein n=1 Tax=Candidatus Lloydbacteria bacterium RIFCSPHIGHO2_01_FULL_49_22 TaxID=1798658 RepID=A0A1G2CWU4_9BACT|nr:MAG: hypothetical protein A2845_03690 [Candidatus Lloydbacteria bacterium RIFCSPHIGHO2_01_FULL_49_22]OGZ09032.1 MAG: hypothetical protein A3C14_03525 [Candidatus Lloydbacteria bacterium RIFCSPHIGHO2_02_FULL_50_18]
MQHLLALIISLACISSTFATTVVPEPQIPNEIQANHSRLICADRIGNKFEIAQYAGEMHIGGVKTKVFMRTTSWNGRKIEQREETWTDTNRSTWSRSVRNSKRGNWLRYGDSEHKEAHEQFLAEIHTTDKEYQSLYKSCVEAHTIRAQ